MEVKLTVGAVEALTTTNSSINLHIRIRKVITIKAALHQRSLMYYKRSSFPALSWLRA